MTPPRHDTRRLVRRSLVATALAWAFLGGCASSDRDIARRVKLRLREQVGFLPDHTTLVLEFGIEGWIWIRDREVRLVAVDAGGVEYEFRSRLTMGEPERWLMRYDHFTPAEVERWLPAEGTYEITAHLGPVRSDPLTFSRRSH